MDCRTTSVDNFKTKLGFKQHHIILTKTQSVLTKIMSYFEGENVQTQYNVFRFRIDLYFHDYKLSIESDENGHSDKNIDYKTKSKR